MIQVAPIEGQELRRLAVLAGHMADTLPGDSREQHDNIKWAAAKVGPAWGDIGAGYLREVQRMGYRKANQRLHDHSPLVRHDLYLAADDADIRAFCDRRVRECAELMHGCHDVLHALRACAAVLDRYGMHWPAPSSRKEGPSFDLMTLVKRLCCGHWWRRQVRRLQAREVDQLARLRKQVAKFRQVYCSDWVMNQRRAAVRRNQETLSQTVAVNDAGQEFTLAELAQLGPGDLKNRRAELMTRIRGFEEVASERGHVGEFWTFTTASKWHRMRWLKDARRAVPVERWNGSTPRQVQDQLCKLWARIRAEFDREGIRVYGFRVVEPHHDGTPHWHLLVFMLESDRKRARKICRKHLLSDDGQEKGAWRARFVAKAMDPAKGTAAGYIAKYIAKNIDGCGVRGSLQLQDDDSGLSMESGADRVRAWAAAWGIRQFQQVGGPSVTVWRELRRLWAEGEPGQGDLFGDCDVEAAGQAADAGDWASYVQAMGGPLLPRCDRPVRPGYWIEHAPSGEPGRDVTRYGDKAKGSIFGLYLRCGFPVLTRFYRWAIEHRPEKNPDVPIGPGAAALVGDVDVQGGIMLGLVKSIFGAPGGGAAFAPQRGALDLCH